jgi:hypothetical protein
MNNLPEKIDGDARAFTPNELDLIERLSDVTDRSTRKQKSQAAGFCETHVFWLLKHREGFAEAVRERTLEHVRQTLPSAYQRLCQIALRGNSRDALRAIELLLRAVGDIQPGGAAVQVNVAGGQTWVKELQTKSRAELAAMLQSELQRLAALQSSAEVAEVTEAEVVEVVEDGNGHDTTED